MQKTSLLLPAAMLLEALPIPRHVTDVQTLDSTMANLGIDFEYL